VRPDWSREIEVIEEPKRKRRQDDEARLTRERTRQEDALDEALKDTFPASDPVSAEQPISRAADRDSAKRLLRAADGGSVAESGRLRRRRHGSRNTGMAAGVKPRSREAVRHLGQGFTRDDSPGENE
jgi:hypothetical protein